MSGKPPSHAIAPNGYPQAAAHGANAPLRPRWRLHYALLPPQQTRMAHNGTTFKLNTGAQIPALGFGTWQDKEAQEP